MLENTAFSPIVWKDGKTTDPLTIVLAHLEPCEECTPSLGEPVVDNDRATYPVLGIPGIAGAIFMREGDRWNLFEIVDEGTTSTVPDHLSYGDNEPELDKARG